MAPRRKRPLTPPLTLLLLRTPRLKLRVTLLLLLAMRPAMLPLLRAMLLLLRAMLPLRKLPRNRLLLRSKRLLYGLNGRADGAETPRLPPAVHFPGS